MSTKSEFENRYTNSYEEMINQINKINEAFLKMNDDKKLTESEKQELINTISVMKKNLDSSIKDKNYNPKEPSGYDESGKKYVMNIDIDSPTKKHIPYTIDINDENHENDENPIGGKKKKKANRQSKRIVSKGGVLKTKKQNKRLRRSMKKKYN